MSDTPSSQTLGAVAQTGAPQGGPPSGRKNIVVCCDGTGNKFVDIVGAADSNSNVVKLYTTLKFGNDQVAYYHPGVGTAGDPSAKSWIASKWSIIKGLAFAEGFEFTVLDAYRYLMEVYNDGDHIYIFGFSRGSYTARALAGLLDGYGLLCRGNESHLPYAWNEYIKQHENRTHDGRPKDHISPNEAFKETFSRKRFSLHFVGVWDTVSSVGWISTPLRLFNVAHNPTIRTGRHAISIDERRCFYRDNLWGKGNPDQDLVQVWFPGVHSDVGGSYPQAQSALPNVTLNWLLTEAEDAGLITDPVMKKLVLGDLPGLLPNPSNDSDINEKNKKIASLIGLYQKPLAYWPVHRSLRRAWWILEFLPHRYYDKDDKAENWRTPLGMRRKIPAGALVHPSVLTRMNDTTAPKPYEPKNLDKDELEPLPVGSIQTVANLDGFFRFIPKRHAGQPFWNYRWVRWIVMFVVSFIVNPTIILLVATVVAWLVCGLWRLWLFLLPYYALVLDHAWALAVLHIVPHLRGIHHVASIIWHWLWPHYHACCNRL